MPLCKDFVTDVTTQNVPSVPRATGLLCLILNILPFPGLGSVIAGLQANSSSTVLIGIIQFFLFPGLIGFIWSVWWGVLIYRKSQFHEAVLLGISIYSNQ
mmetsp:Transcript_19854/g.47337  ORF Transcript_19854/g.47337 Transcript_19854/m.47337 type:complete len:100 (-) Transcript_19854:808-1107(-)